MSVHSSLKSKERGRQHRSVLKRFERIRKLKEEEKWDDEKDSVFRLPKVKMVKVHVKKHKAAEAEAAEAEAGAAAGGGTSR